MTRRIMLIMVGLTMLCVILGSVRGIYAQQTYTETLACSDTDWIALPSNSDMHTAEDLCASIIPTPISVAQMFPQQTGSTMAGEYIYNCLSPQCTASDPSLPIPESPACGSTCFCVDPGEGYWVKPNAPGSTFTVTGCDELVPITLPPAINNATQYLISVPFHTSLTTWESLGLYFGGSNTGLKRDVVAGIGGCNPSTNMATFTNCSLGMTMCQTFAIMPGTTYQLTRVSTAGITVTNPVGPSPPPPPSPTACPG